MDLAIKIGQPLTICEDDAIFNRQFDLHAEQVIGTLPAEWDLVLWGWNFDLVLSVEVLPGVANSQILFEQMSMNLNGAAFRELSISPRAFKLLWAWGIPNLPLRLRETVKSMLLPLRPISIPT